MRFSREFLENRVFTNKRLQTVPLGMQSECIHAFEEVLTELGKENPYVTLSELFDKSKSEPDVPTESLSE